MREEGNYNDHLAVRGNIHHSWVWLVFWKTKVHSPSEHSPLNTDSVMSVLKSYICCKRITACQIPHPQGFIKTVNRRLGSCNPDIAEVHHFRPDLNLLKVKNKRSNQLRELYREPIIYSSIISDGLYIWVPRMGWT